MEYTIGIVGFGFVGKAIQHGFAQTTEFRIFDVDERKRTHSLEDTVKDSDFIFVCLPTPSNFDTGAIDLSIMDEMMGKIDEFASVSNKVIIIKSTVIPGTTDKYQRKYQASNFVFNPEFLTERTYRLDFINASRIILGGANWNTQRVKKLYEDRFPGTPVYCTSAKAAELVKYCANCFFAVKVSYMNEVHQICQKLDLDYNEVIQMVLADGRIGNSHYSVPGHDGSLGFGGKCFPKDIKAMIHLAYELGIDPLVMQAAWEKNMQVRDNHDWNEIEGAVSNDSSKS